MYSIHNDGYEDILTFDPKIYYQLIFKGYVNVV